MNNLQQYILEKLHIDKDTEITKDYDFGKEEMFLNIHITLVTYTHHISCLYLLSRFVNIEKADNNFYTIKYELNTSYRGNYKTMENVYVNDKGFYQAENKHSESTDIYILLNKQTAIEFFKQCLDTNFEQDVIQNYIDSKFEDKIDGPIHSYTSDEFFRARIEDLEKDE